MTDNSNDDLIFFDEPAGAASVQGETAGQPHSPARCWKILIVDDEKDIVDLVAYNLEKEGHEVLKAYDGERAIQSIRSKGPDLVILDLMLPGVDGLEVCRALRRAPESRALPIIMLTARSEESDRIVGFELGADDYVTKPFSPRELLARINAVLRRSSATGAGETLEAGGLVLDPASHRVTADGQTVSLGPTPPLVASRAQSRSCAVRARPSAQPAPFSLEQVTGFTFPSDLVAAPRGQRIAWAMVTRGVRNLFVAERLLARIRDLSGGKRLLGGAEGQ